MNVITLCEESQEVMNSFLMKGHNAYSCDLQDPSGAYPGRHFKCDAIKLMNKLLPEWDGLVISFPPCTDLANSGSKHFMKKRLNGQQEQAIRFFIEMWKVSNVVENPINILCGYLEKESYMRRWFPEIVEEMIEIGMPNRYSQIIQPYEHGHSTTKATCLWVKGLPLLQPSNIVECEEMITLSSGKRMSKWYYETSCLPHKDRAKARSKTFPGIAKAMADQWG